jgi:hypothetical protein
MWMIRHARSGRAIRAAALAAWLVVTIGGRGGYTVSAVPAQNTLRLDSSVTLVVSPTEAEPIRRAVDDLAGDFASVFGTRPRIVTRPEDAGPVAVMVGMQADLPAALRSPDLTAPESFAMSAVPLAGRGAPTRRVVLLTGPDLRGTIYSVYQFSQDYLGVDPMYYWTDRVPARRTAVSVPGDLARRFPAPLFKYRGFFINDEDLLTGWAPGEATDKTGISLAVWNKIYETVLRLKGNMVVPGTWIFPTDPQVKLVGERGLIMTQHHAIPLGVNVARWPAGVPYNYTTHPEILDRAWTNAVNAYDPQQEILWSVGLRGLSDTSYASQDPSVAGDDKALGHLISKAIADQIGIVRSVRPNASFVTDFWSEGAHLVQQGDLMIPSGVIPVWADTGYGLMQDGGLVSKGQGAYYHVAMLNGRANQLSEMVPVARIYSELGRYIQAGATQYLLVNTSDIRPVAMTARAVMDVAWGGVPPGDPAPAARAYYPSWAAAEFGEAASTAVAKVLADYFVAPAHLPNSPYEYGDTLYHGEARQMLMSAMISTPYYSLPSQSPKWTMPRVLGGGDPGAGRGMGSADFLTAAIAREIDRCGQARWDAVWQEAQAAESLVVPRRRPYYRAEVLTMTIINRNSNRMLVEVANAVRDAKAGRGAQARAEAQRALADLDEIRQWQAGAEYGKWRHWYRGDWLTGVDETRQLIQTFLRYLDDPNITLPPPVIASGWQAYYHIMHYEGDQTVDVR